MSVSTYYDENAAGYTDQYDPAKIWSNQEYPANLFRLQLVERLIEAAGSSSVYEVGVGEATPLSTIGARGITVAGCDLSQEMVKVARQNMRSRGLSEEAISWIDVQDDDAMLSEQRKRGHFDTVMALGVIPHVPDDEAFVSTMSSFLRPGGQLLLQFRNSLFSMFTFNRLTKEFILDELLIGVPDEIREIVELDLDKRLAVELPPKRTSPTGNGYDEILSRFHNPFELANVVRDAGFTDIRYHWYNYHPAYPMLASQIDARDFREAQVALEHEGSWRGMFLCSAGLIEATKHP